MRIAMVQATADPDRDGVAGYTADLGAALGAAGIEVAAVPVVGTPASVARATRTVRWVRPDLVHLQFSPSAFGFRPWPGRYGLGPSAMDLQGLPGCSYRRPTAVTDQVCWRDGHCPLSDGGPACMLDLSLAIVDAALAALASR